jgi:hypothetical protein
MIHVYLLGIMANNKFPWGFCKIEVKCGERALQCEGRCTQWFHCRCVFGFEITNAQYKKISVSEEEWHCASCTGNLHIPFNRINAIDVFHFDFQKNIPTPKLTVGKQFYLRLLWTCAFCWSHE